MKKNDRHVKIVEIINSKNIETQEELAEELKNCGLFITQATVSRDIRDLKLLKIPSENNGYKYILPSKNESQIYYNKYMDILKNTIISVESVNNFIVVKTLNGSATAAAEGIDNMGYNAIIGTLAGDNTIFILLRDNDSARNIQNDLSKLIES